LIVVTGGAGFIGSHFLEILNQQGVSDLLVADDLSDGKKIHNLAGRSIADYLDHEDFLSRFEDPQEFSAVRAVIHQGACSATTEWNGRYLMKVNYEYSKRLLAACQARRIPLVYASSASVYGLGLNGFREALECELPINAYAYSKWQFDQYVRRVMAERVAPIIGLRYFNVYGTREAHKGSMASTIHHFSQQILETGKARLFAGSHGYGPGEQRRDFVDVRDCVSAALWLLDGGMDRSGIFNIGTGTARPFNDVARVVCREMQTGEVEYVPFPEHLMGAYQAFTEADLTALRDVGYTGIFRSIDDGIPAVIASRRGTP
jgi:ADP-L-glycero-D-manno-heptose 6-epimerase